MRRLRSQQVKKQAGAHSAQCPMPKVVIKKRADGMVLPLSFLAAFLPWCCGVSPQSHKAQAAPQLLWDCAAPVQVFKACTGYSASTPLTCCALRSKGGAFPHGFACRHCCDRLCRSCSTLCCATAQQHSSESQEHAADVLRHVQQTRRCSSGCANRRCRGRSCWSCWTLC